MANPTRHFVATVPARTVAYTDWTAYEAVRKAEGSIAAKRQLAAGKFEGKNAIPAQVWLRSSNSQVYASASPQAKMHDIQWHRAGGSKVGPYSVREVTKAEAEELRAKIQARHQIAGRHYSPAPGDSWVNA